MKLVSIGFKSGTHWRPDRGWRHAVCASFLQRHVLAMNRNRRASWQWLVSQSTCLQGFNLYSSDVHPVSSPCLQTEYTVTATNHEHPTSDAQFANHLECWQFFNWWHLSMNNKVSHFLLFRAFVLEEKISFWLLRGVSDFSCFLSRQIRGNLDFRRDLPGEH